MRETRRIFSSFFLSLSFPPHTSINKTFPSSLKKKDRFLERFSPRNRFFFSLLLLFPPGLKVGYYWKFVRRVHAFVNENRRERGREGGVISRLPIRATRALDPRDNLGEESKFISFITDGASSRGVLEYRRCKAERINPQPSVGGGKEGTVWVVCRPTRSRRGWRTLLELLVSPRPGCRAVFVAAGKPLRNN